MGQILFRDPARQVGAHDADDEGIKVFDEFPRRDLVVGMRVRAGDRIGSVNVLGVGQDVVSPVDGVIGSSLAEAGEAVEYGQELVRIELPESPAVTDAARAEREPAGVAGNA